MFDPPEGTVWDVLQLNLPAIVLVLVGIAIRLWVSGRYLEAHARVYRSAPPRGWLWTSVDDRETEKWRRVMALGTVLTIAGLVLLLLRFIPPPPP